MTHSRSDNRSAANAAVSLLAFAAGFLALPWILTLYFLAVDPDEFSAYRVPALILGGLAVASFTGSFAVALVTRSRLLQLLPALLLGLPICVVAVIVAVIIIGPIAE